MANKDKIKWNKKYKEIPALLEQETPSTKLKKYINQTKGKKALEIACGGGRNSVFMAQNDFEVTALDISELAIKSLNNKNYSNIKALVVDLEEYKIEKNSFDLIIQTNFLDRKIIPMLCDSLKKDGIIIIETYMHHEINEKPISNTSFLLEKEELKSFFDSSFEILEYDEYDNEQYELYKMKKQAIIVKKI